MSTTWIIVALVLGFLVVFQIAKASEYVAILKGEEKNKEGIEPHQCLLASCFPGRRALWGLVLQL